MLKNKIDKALRIVKTTPTVAQQTKEEVGVKLYTLP
jgi:hypothetical protein